MKRPLHASLIADVSILRNQAIFETSWCRTSFGRSSAKMDKRPASVAQDPPSAPRRLAGAGSSQGSDRKKARIEMDENDDEEEEEEEQDKRPTKRRKKVVPVEGNAVVVDAPLAEQAEFMFVHFSREKRWCYPG
jgi:hypothetical protein